MESKYRRLEKSKKASETRMQGETKRVLKDEVKEVNECQIV
jgi:hypothetical protein